jgi:general secretion pathway protein G
MGLWLMIGITVIAVLLATSIPKYKSLLLKTKESVLENNLLETRLVIKQYINDKQQAPHSLQDLVDAGYFRNLPTDPITKSNSSWRPVIETVVITHGRTDRGITDLHSGSSSISSKGTVYSVW